MKNVILSCLLLFGFVSVIQGKRVAAPKVQPVTHKGVMYVAPGLKKMKSGKALAVVTAKDAKSGRLLYSKLIYTIRYDSELERDVQDIYITSLAIKSNKLIILNESKDKFVLDLETKKLTPSSKVYSRLRK